MLAESLNGLRAEARSNVVVAVCAQALSPTLSQMGEGVETYHYHPLRLLGVLRDSAVTLRIHRRGRRDYAEKNRK